MRWEVDGQKVVAWIDKNTYYCTDAQGHGVFFIDLIRNNKEQLTGSLQFSVYGLKPESKKNKLRKWLSERDYLK